MGTQIEEFTLPDSASDKGAAEVHQTTVSAWDTKPSFQKSFEDMDWGRTRLGPRDGWDPELSQNPSLHGRRHLQGSRMVRLKGRKLTLAFQVVRFMMADTSPCLLFWGESNSVIYNEASECLIGDGYTATMGLPAEDGLPRLWEVFGECILEQRRNGLAAQGEAVGILVERDGLLEETYIDWKLLPVLGTDGQVKSSYGMPIGLTDFIVRQ